MTKLNEKKIKWLINQIDKHGKIPKEIAPVYKISVRRVQQLVAEYRKTGEYPKIKKNRRPQVNLTIQQKELIKKTYLEHFVGARLLKVVLDHDYPDNRIAKNKIHAYLKELGHSKPDKKKQKPRKRCRYERKHSGSLTHMDTHICKWHPNLKLITVLDDASRFILAASEVTNATAHNAIKTLKMAKKRALEYNLRIRAVNTDRGPEFFAVEKGKKKRKEHQFVLYLQSQGIRHILSRVNNPQTNGKLERFHREYKKHRPRFKTLKEFVDWYNMRIHGGVGTRPKRAFINKLPQETMVGLFFREELK